MRATGWSNGNPSPSGAGLGLRISKADRDRYFLPGWECLVLVLPGVVITVPLSASFWRTCTEFRSAALGRWLLQSGLAPWPKGAPPTVALLPIKDDRFALMPC